MEPYDVTLIGAGMGSLTLAALLARSGRRVRVLERAPREGGKAAVREEGGFVYDEGPSILVLRKIYEDLFVRLGMPMEEHLVFDTLDPAFRVRGIDGSEFHIHSDFVRTLASVRTGLGANAEQELRAFVEGLDPFARVIGLAYADRTFTRWLDFADPRLVASGLFVSPFAKYRAFIDARIRHPLLREFLYGFPGYAGYHPEEAPASLVLLPWSILREGVFYPRGGVAAIPRAIRRIAEEAGAVFHFGVTVESLSCTQGPGQTHPLGEKGVRVRRLATSAGEILVGEKEQVVFGGCLGWLSSKGAPELFSAEKKRSYGAQSPSFFTLQAAMPKARREALGLGHHNLFLPLREGEGYMNYFEPGSPYPDLPPLYVNIPSVTDRHVAPDGMDNVFVVVSVASHTDARAAQEAADAYAQRCARWLGAYLPGFELAAAPLAVKASAQFERDLLQKGGQIYGPSLREAQILAGFARPHPRLPGVENLWLVGGSTQPGAGLPMVVQSGKIVAEALLKETEK